MTRTYDILLDRYHYDTLTAFGPLDRSVNAILANYMTRQDLLDSLQPVAYRQGCSHHKILVTNDDYLAITADSHTSPTYSLRRVLYDFVDNERWEDFGMTPDDSYVVDRKEQRRQRLLQEVLSRLSTLYRLTDDDTQRHYVSTSLKLLSKLTTEEKDERP